MFSNFCSSRYLSDVYSDTGTVKITCRILSVWKRGFDSAHFSFLDFSILSQTAFSFGIFLGKNVTASGTGVHVLPGPCLFDAF
jgi:hypothetical protein